MLSENTDGYALELRLRIDWSEMDLFGHVNNVMFMKYVQAARVNYWETIGLTQLHQQEGRGPMLASTGCRFLKPLHYPGELRVLTRLAFIKNTSFGFKHLLLNAGNEPVAEAEDVVVFYNFHKSEKEMIPDFLRERIRHVEEKRIY